MESFFLARCSVPDAQCPVIDAGPGRRRGPCPGLCRHAFNGQPEAIDVVYGDKEPLAVHRRLRVSVGDIFLILARDVNVVRSLRTCCGPWQP